jgi:putative aldouronate transport system permease protein
MRPVIILMFILAMGRIFYSDFGLFYLVPRESNSLHNAVYTIDVFVYKQLKTATVGMASASAFTQSVIGCLSILAANWLVRKVDPESAMI